MNEVQSAFLVLAIVAVLILFWNARHQREEEARRNKRDPDSEARVKQRPEVRDQKFFDPPGAQAKADAKALEHPQTATSPRGVHVPDRLPESQIMSGKCYVEDGDTIYIKSKAIRLFGIDAPEMNHPYGRNAKWAMVKLCKGQKIRAEVLTTDPYGRLVARCYLPDGRDLSAELVKQGLAIDWPKHSGGVYRRYETEDARKRLWRAVARQQGRQVE